MAGEMERRGAAGSVARRIEAATLNDVRLVFRNFKGAEGQYNRKGDRNFCVILPADTADAMRQDGWSIKQLKPREEGDVPQDYIKVKVNFDGPRPPKMFLINSMGRLQITNDMVENLDWIDFALVDLIISPYNWSMNGNTGVTAYLQTFFGTIREDELEQRYSQVPDAGPHPEGASNILVWQESTPEEIEVLKMRELES